MFSDIILSPYIVSALIGATITVLGWMTSGVMRRRETARMRAERRDDMQKAIYAEIRAYVAILERDSLDYFGPQVVKRIREQDFVPFLAKENHSIIFLALLQDIHILPLETIDIITVYYQTVGAISDIILDMRADSYKALSSDRRAVIYEDYISMKKFALEIGRDAMERIQIYSKGGKEAVQQWDRTKLDSHNERELHEVKKWITHNKNQ